MNLPYSPELRDEILHYGHEAVRTPLHIKFQKDQTDMVPAEALDLEQARLKKYSMLFNAVGSRVVQRSDASPTHLPVLDVDGGAEISVVQRETYASHRLVMSAFRRGSYEPTTELPELLGDYGIAYEVFHQPRGRLVARYMNGRSQKYIAKDLTDHESLGVQSLVMRAREPIFRVVPSTQEGHSHAFINTEFTDSDNEILLSELCALGVVSKGWVDMARRERMGIVRTPWTQKHIKEPVS
jgi:hypothetical protein